MLQLNPKSNLFAFKFPEEFWVQGICEKFDEMLKAYGGTFERVKDLVNESIQEVTLPGFSFEPVIQNSASGPDRHSAENQNLPDLSLKDLYSSKRLIIAIRHSDAFLTYFCLLEHFYYYFESKRDDNVSQNNKETTKKQFTIPINMLMRNGHPLYSVVFERCLFVSIPELPLSYINIQRDFKQFSIEFTFSTSSAYLNIPKITAKKYKDG